MKKFGLLLIISVFILSMAALVACQRTPLVRPVDLKVDVTKNELTWRSVPNASGYVVEVNGTEYNTNDNLYKLGEIQPGRYTFRVKALGEGKNFVNSMWSEALTEQLDIEQGLVYTLINNGAEWEVSSAGRALGNITVGATFKGLPITTIGRSAFAGKVGITSVTLGKNIHTIKEYAFQDCKDLTEFFFADSRVTIIGTYGFSYCRNLESISLPDSLTTLGTYAFLKCESLKDLYIGKGLTSISLGSFKETGFETLSLGSEGRGENLIAINSEAFYACKSLETLEIAGKIETIGAFSFSANTALTTVTIRESLRAIGPSAFRNNTLLTGITIPENVTTVANYAFVDTGLWEYGKLHNDGYIMADKWLVGYTGSKTTLHLPDEVEAISDACFTVLSVDPKNADNYLIDGGTFKSVVFNENLRIIGELAFYMCDGIEEITIPESITKISALMFSECRNLKKVTLHEYVTEIGEGAFRQCDSLNNVVIPNSVVSIGDYAYFSCNALKDVTIGDGVRKIGTWAFYETKLWQDSLTPIIFAGNWIVGVSDTNLKSVSFDDKSNIVGIGNLAFSECIYLESVEIPSTVKTIGDYAFYKNEKLTEVVIPDSVEEIGDYAFFRCTSVKTLTIGSNSANTKLTTIGVSAFRNMESLEEVVIPNSVVDMGDSVFRDCVSLTKAIIGDGVQKIGKYAFYGCTILGNVGFGKGIKVIDNYAFYKCTNLRQVHLQEGVETIGRSAFYECRQLRVLSLPDTLTDIGEYAFFKCEQLYGEEIDGAKVLVIPDGVTVLRNYAFYGCLKLESVMLPANLEEIQIYVFFNSSIANLVLPSTLKSIGMYAFRNCGIMGSIIIPSSVETIGAHAFNGANNLTFYCESTKVQPGWDARWNSSYRPIFFGSKLSDDKTYVVSFDKQIAIANTGAFNGMHAPYKKGSIFGGWSKTAGGTTADYTMETVKNAPNITLYAIWY